MYVTVKALVAIGLWGAAAIGYLFTPLNWAERLYCLLAACFLVAAVPWTDEIGVSASAAFLVWHLWRARQLRTAAA